MEHPPSSQALTFSASVCLFLDPLVGYIGSGEVNALAISGTTGRIHRWIWRSGW
jgi:hypothetical protein